MSTNINQGQETLKQMCRTFSICTVLLQGPYLLNLEVLEIAESRRMPIMQVAYSTNTCSNQPVLRLDMVAVRLQLLHQTVRPTDQSQTSTGAESLTIHLFNTM